MPDGSTYQALDEGDQPSPTASAAGVRRNAMVMLFSVLLVLCGTMQAVTFKRAGYSLGPYPYFILLAVSFSFVPLLFAVVAYVRWRAGGFIGEQTSWTFKKVRRRGRAHVLE